MRPFLPLALLVLTSCGDSTRCHANAPAQCDGDIARTCRDLGEEGWHWNESDCGLTTYYPNNVCSVGTTADGRSVAGCATSETCDDATFQSYCDEDGRAVSCGQTDHIGISDCPAWNISAECFANENSPLATCVPTD